MDVMSPTSANENVRNMFDFCQLRTNLTGNGLVKLEVELVVKLTLS